MPKRLERARGARLLSVRDDERRGADDLDEAAVRLPEVLVNPRCEQRGRNRDVRGGARLTLHDLDPEARLVVLDDGELVAVRLEPGERRLDVARKRGLGLDESVRDDEVRCRRA